MAGGELNDAVLGKARIAHFSGQTATIQNTPPLVTSNKARNKYGLELLTNADGAPIRFDALRAQRLAAPVTIYVEQFSAHPLEADASELYGPPDGYLSSAGVFKKERSDPADKPVYEVELQPEDGLYPLPYMARQIDGRPWDEEGAFPGAPPEKVRQSFFPDGSRGFEEIDRLQLSEKGLGNVVSSIADLSFFRVLPPAGYTKGLAAKRRTDVGEGDIPPERRGVDFFAYRPVHLRASAPRSGLARAANVVQRVLGSGEYDGAIWTEGSPAIEEMIYWLNLLVDTTLPICGAAAQRPQGAISNDGPKNIADAVTFIASRIWSDERGCNRAGAVLVAEQRVFAARMVQKGDARPGGYTATGGHGGILGAVGYDGPPVLEYLPTRRHTYRSEVRLSQLPAAVRGVTIVDDRIASVTVPIKSGDGMLLESAVPKVVITKEASYAADDSEIVLEREVDLVAMIDHMLRFAPLAGYVVEGLTPYGTMPSPARRRLMLRAIYSGIPVVQVGRGNTAGFATVAPPFIGGSNLTSTKARLLLMASLLEFGSLPPATDPDAPTTAEIATTREKVAAYQAIFDTH